MSKMASSASNKLVFFVNGKKEVEINPDPEVTLLHYLRNKCTKLGCGEGGCGACTVMVSSYNKQSQEISHSSVNACLLPICSLHGLSVTTVEAVGSTRTKLHPIQEGIAYSHGSQCGFCTPGMVMSMYTLLRNKPVPAQADIELAFQGNLCRCTGYRPILAGLKPFTQEFQCCMGKNCCMEGQNSTKSQCCREIESDGCKFCVNEPTQEPIFPSELQLWNYGNESLVFCGPRATWYRSTSLEELVSLKAEHPEAKIVVGNTELGIEQKTRGECYPVLIAATHVPDLYQITHAEDGIEFGASTSLTSFNNALIEAIKIYPDYTTQAFAAIVDMLHWFAGTQIRNVASIAGNIMTASPISDLNPLFMAAGCWLKITSKGGEKRVKMDDRFFLGYRKTVLEPEDILVSITIPFTRKNEYMKGYKQAQRREDDISIVNAGMRVLLRDDCTIEDLAISYGGMAPVTVMALNTMDKLKTRLWDKDMVEEACCLLMEDLPLPPGTPGGMETYRSTLTTSFFYKFYLTVLDQLYQHGKVEEGVARLDQSAIAGYKHTPSTGFQGKEEPGPDQPLYDGVGRSKPHLTSLQQVTGEAQFTDDVPTQSGELYLALVTSKKAHARLVKVDPSPALNQPGVKAFISSKDVPGDPISYDGNPIFADQLVFYEGMTIGAVVAETQVQAQRAARAVVVEYEQLKPIITIEEAIEAGSFHQEPFIIDTGNLETALSEADHVVEGSVRIGGQEHFYLETQASLVKPRGENNELEIYCSTQAPQPDQAAVCAALGIPMNRVTVHTKRIGGGFGGKETQAKFVLVPCAIAAHKLNRPVRCMLDRSEDMVITGTRHPMLCRYKVGFSDAGKLMALSLRLYSNCGYSSSVSKAVMKHAMTEAENAYKIPHMKVEGILCKTNLSPNTAFRGFGAPQAMFFMESIISHVASTLKIYPEEVRALNLYSKGDVTYCNQEIPDDNLRRCWREIITNDDLQQRRENILHFNRMNRWKKRGLSLIPTKYGLAFKLCSKNQGGALVHVYVDGSVLVSHGGVEMGQGLYTKMIQVASRALGVPMEKMHISETTTASVPNASPTAASVSTDLYGMAVLNACQQIKDRLEPIRAKKPDMTWEELIKTAYDERVGLSATGFYKTPDLGYDLATNSGRLFNYLVMGAAVSEVEMDCLTGDHTVLSTDILMDAGQSLNPAIDIGQIEGAFVQGYGLYVREFHRYSPEGSLLSRGPSSYKIPGFTDIPGRFNVSLLKDSYNTRAVFSSRGLGEPPLFLASSVFFAIREAIAAARRDSGLTTPFTLNSPATVWQVRMACQDRFTKQFPEADPSTYTPWFVYP